MVFIALACLSCFNITPSRVTATRCTFLFSTYTVDQSKHHTVHWTTWTMIGLLFLNNNTRFVISERTYVHLRDTYITHTNTHANWFNCAALLKYTCVVYLQSHIRSHNLSNANVREAFVVELGKRFQQSWTCAHKLGTCLNWRYMATVVFILYLFFACKHLRHALYENKTIKQLYLCQQIWRTWRTERSPGVSDVEICPFCIVSLARSSPASQKKHVLCKTKVYNY